MPELSSQDKQSLKWLAIVGAIITTLYAGCMKALEWDKELDAKTSVIDSLKTNDSLLFAEVADIRDSLKLIRKENVRLRKIKSSKGVLWKTWDFFFKRNGG